MEETPIRERIRARSERLSPSQRRLAEFVLDNMHRVAFMTAARLGGEVGVSESTVVRFAAALGYTGYPALQKDLQAGIRAELTAAERLELSRIRGDGVEAVLQQVLRADMLNIRNTLQDVSKDSFEKVVDRLEHADSIYLLALRSATAVGYYLNFYLNFLRSSVYLLDVGGPIFEQLAGVGPRDLVMAISFPRYSRLTVDVFAHARQRGACTVAMTDTVLAPLAAQADVTLLARSAMMSFADSLVAPLSLANALITALALRNSSATQRSLRELEEVWDRYDIYLIPEGR